VIATDLSETLTAVGLPVYFLHGRYDYTVSYPLAKAYDVWASPGGVGPVGRP
jgi:hypothetical protein